MQDFFEVLGYPRYKVDRNGTLIDTQTNKQKTWYIQKPQKHSGGRVRNMRRGYLIARIVTPDGTKRHIFQHRVLAELFIPCPGVPKDYLVNHIDGDGGNNALDNLDWTTYSENMLHAYATGLCGNTHKVETRNVLTKELTVYNSIADCSREHDIPHATLKHRLTKSPGKVFENNYSYRYHGSDVEWSDEVVKTIKPKYVFALNAFTGILTIADNQKELSKLINIKEGTINATLNKGRVAPVDGYVIGWEGTLKEKPQFTSRQLELFKLKRPKSDVVGWAVIDTVDNTERIVLVDDYANELGITRGRLVRQLENGISGCNRYKYEKVLPYPETHSPLME